MKSIWFHLRCTIPLCPWVLLCFPAQSNAQATQYAYVTNFGSDAVTVFKIDPNSGALAQTSVAATGINPFAVGIDPAGRFAFVSNSADVPGGVPSISVYSIDPTTGALTPVAGSPFPTSLGSPYGLMIHPNGEFLYVAHDLSSSVVTAYSIDRRTGALSPLPGSPYPTNGANAWSVATDPAGKFLYVANGTTGNIPAYSIDANTGALTPVAGSPFASLHDVLKATVVPSGRFLYVDNSAFNSISGYSIDFNSGALTPVAGSPFPAGAGPVGVVTDSAGRFLYATNRDSGSVSAFSIDSASGALTPVSGSPFPVGGLPYHVAVDSTNNFLYVTNFNSNNVTAYAINASTGALTPLAGSPFVTGTQPFWIAIATVIPSTQLTLQPSSGGNAGNVTVQIFGGGMQNGATVKLTGLGPDIVGTGTALASASVLTTTFSLTGASPGVRDVVVTNPDGSSATLTGGFTVLQGGAPQISVDIIGRNAIRIGSSQVYYVALTNTGTADSEPGIVSLAVPSSLAFAQNSGAGLYVAGNTSSIAFLEQTPSETSATASSSNGNEYLLFATTSVPAGGTVIAPVQLTDSLSSSSDSYFTLTAQWQYAGYPTSFDEYLSYNNLSYYGITGLLTNPQCSVQPLTSAYNAAAGPYAAYQNSRGVVIGDLGLLSANIGKAKLEDSLLAQFKVPLAVGVALAGLVQVTDSCVSNVFNTSTNQGCLPDLETDLKATRDMATTAIAKNPAFPPPVQNQLGEFAFWATAAADSIDNVQALNTASTNEQTDFANFQTTLANYQTAFATYETCINASPQQGPPVGTGTYTLSLYPVQSLDPNDKMGGHGSGFQQYVSGASSLNYSIYFGNEQTANAPAQIVSISDQLDLNNDDLTTFSLGPVAFGDNILTPPPFQPSYSTTIDLRPTTDLLVAISANFNQNTGLLTWTYSSLDPATNLPPTDPTVGFLPPGRNGSVFFSVRPKQALPTNTQIQNQATIVFDANSPISTPTWSNTLDNTPPTSQVGPLPATELPATFAVNWTGTDIGAGIQYFTIYVSDNGAPFMVWRQNTTATSATFTGQVGHTYGFYSIATDLVGNVEGAKSAAEATTTVSLDTTPPTTTATLSPQPNAAGWNNSNVTVTLTSVDNPGGSGVKQITYSATGAQAIASTIVPFATTPFTISMEGTTTISFFGTDNAGNVEAPHTLIIRLDKTPPTITGSAAPAANGNGWNNTDVIVSFQCSDALSGLAAGSPPAPSTLSNKGAGQSVTGTCTDVAGNSASATASGINIDKTPPTVACSASPNALWPPNNKLVPINVLLTVNDSLSGPGGFTLVSVTSSEPDSGQGDVQGFVTGTASASGLLRATRLGSGTGRVYTLTYTGSDRAGNTASCATTVSVPHDQGQN